jgi:hypothetical protein
MFFFARQATEPNSDDDWENDITEAIGSDFSNMSMLHQQCFASNHGKLKQQLNNGYKTKEAASHARSALGQKRRELKIERETDKRVKTEDAKARLIAMSGRAAKASGQKMTRVDSNSISETRAEALVLALYQKDPVPTLGINFDRVQSFFSTYLSTREKTSFNALMRCIADFRRCSPDNLADLVYDLVFDGTEHKVSGTVLHGVRINIATSAECLVIVPRVSILLMAAGGNNIVRLHDGCRRQYRANEARSFEIDFNVASRGQ